MEQSFTPKLAASMIGLPVCLVLADGSERIGLIAAVRKNRLVLSGPPPIFSWGGDVGISAEQPEDTVRFSDIRYVIPLY